MVAGKDMALGSGLVRSSDGAVKNEPDPELVKNLLSAYRELESRFRITLSGKEVSYVSPVNFTESMSLPRHRWFPYKEGFSPSFVAGFLNKHVSRASGIVLDPFSGVGTTPIVAAQNKYQAVGFDVNPLAVFVAKAKSLQLGEKKLEKFNQLIRKFSSDKLAGVAEAPDNNTVIGYYDPNFLESLLRVKHFIGSIHEEEFSNLFLLSYLSLLEEFSTHRKAGNGVKKKTRSTYSNDANPLQQVRDAMLQHLRTVLFDLSSSIPGSVKFELGSSIESETLHEIDRVSGIVTSPPYANCFDYSKIYMRELWLGGFFTSKEDLRSFRQNSIRSHVHATWEERHSEFSNPFVDDLVVGLLEPQNLWSRKIPSMLSGYFKDLGKFLSTIHEKLCDDAKLGFVVSNSFYGGIPVATDLLLAASAEMLGYKTVEIDVYRGMIPSSQQYRRIEDKYFMRESMVLLSKS